MNATAVIHNGLCVFCFRQKKIAKFLDYGSCKHYVEVELKCVTSVIIKKVIWQCQIIPNCGDFYALTIKTEGLGIKTIHSEAVFVPINIIIFKLLTD